MYPRIKIEMETMNTILFGRVLPDYVFRKKHEAFLLFKSEETAFHKIDVFQEVIKLVRKIQKNDFVSFYDINNPNETNTRIIISLSNYHEILKNIYHVENVSPLNRILECSPLLYFSLLNSNELEYYADTLLNLGIIGTSQANYEEMRASMDFSTLWNDGNEYLKYIHHQFSQESKYTEFKNIFLKNYG